MTLQVRLSAKSCSTPAYKAPSCAARTDADLLLECSLCVCLAEVSLGLLADPRFMPQRCPLEHRLPAVPPSTHHFFARAGLGLAERIRRCARGPHRLAFANRTFGWSFCTFGGKR